MTAKKSVRKTKVTAKAPGYNSSRKSVQQRDVATIESQSESRIVTERRRLLMIADQRDSMRNTIFSPATAQQVQINTVGTVGGKLTLTTDNDRYNEEGGAVFRRWSRHAGFTDGMHFNEMLALMVTQLTHTGGDFIAMFDDGALTTAPGSGRLMIFESDQIKPVKDDIFAAIYGKGGGYYQDNGLVKDKFARIVGAFVGARREDEDIRGNIVYDRGEFLHLKLNTPAFYGDSPWIFVAQTWRPNQGRGIATAQYVTDAIQNMADIIASEIIAGKLNSSIGLIERNRNDAPVDDGRGEVLSDEDAGDLTDEEVAAYNSALKNSVNALQSGGAAIFTEAPGRSLEAFKSERPAQNAVDFVKKIEGMATTPFGFGRLFATLDPESSYIAARGAMVLARKSFERMQKKMERTVLDWIVPRVFRYYGVKIPADLDECLYWSWPDMVEIDESAFQTALEKKYGNFESSLKARHGAEWKKYVDSVAEEVAYCAERGVMHPCLRTVSGGQVEVEAPATDQTTEKDKDK